MISVRNVTRAYSSSGPVLDGVSLEVGVGEFVAITGPSGCGKSTLLHLIGGLDTPTSGEIQAAGVELHRADEETLTDYRRRLVGVIFQFFNLLPTMTVMENVCLPAMLQGLPMSSVRSRAQELLELVGLSERAEHFPHQLSGGQMQRTAIARALIHQPKLLLADEPTGNLDTGHAEQVMQLLQKIASLHQTTLLVVTHSADVASAASRRISMRDGKILSSNS